jgi:hypothetical protein
MDGPRMKLTLLLLCLLVSATVARAQTAQLPPGTQYVMSHFKADGGGGDERLYISISPDGLRWTALNNGNPVWQPANWAPFSNVVRDPSIIFNNGFWWVAYTSGTYGHHASFGLVKSPDLINWTFVGEIDATIPGAAAQYGASYDPLTWNPVFYSDSDGSVHVFVNISPINGSQYNPTPKMNPYELHPANNDWTQWSAPALVGLQDGDTNEFYVWKTGATYNAIFVNFNNGSAWTYATSSSLLTGWQDVRSIGFNNWEGGMIIPQSDSSGRLYLEPGNGAPTPGYQWCESYDNLVSFSAQHLVNSDVPMRNGKMTSDFPQSELVPALSRLWLGALGVLLFVAAARSSRINARARRQSNT